MRRRLNPLMSCFIATVLWSNSLLSVVQAEELETPSKRLAARFENLLAEMKQTDYQSKTEIDEQAGRLLCDCSGLMCYVLRHDFPEAYLSLQGQESPWRTRPYSVTFYETFAAANAENTGSELWQRVPKIADARPGDILAWRKTTIEKGVSTGHTCLIAGIPKQESDGRFRVRVIDSTRKLHSNDTRPEGTTGVGAGDMWFVPNHSGEPVAFYVNEKGKRITANKISIGRMIKVEHHHGKQIRSREQLTTEHDREYLGLKITAARKLAKENQLMWRVISKEGETRPVSMKIRQDRVNFIVEKGVVIRVRRG